MNGTLGPSTYEERLRDISGTFRRGVGGTSLEQHLQPLFVLNNQLIGELSVRACKQLILLRLQRVLVCWGLTVDGDRYDECLSPLIGAGGVNGTCGLLSSIVDPAGLTPNT